MISRPCKEFYKKLFVKKFIILTSILSYIIAHTAILFTKKVWITFYFLFSEKNKIFNKISRFEKLK